MRIPTIIGAVIALAGSASAAVAAPAFAVLGNLVIAGLMGTPLGLILPAASAAAIGAAVVGCSKGAKTIIRRLRK